MSCVGLSLVFSKGFLFFFPHEGIQSLLAASLPSRTGKMLESQGLMALGTPLPARGAPQSCMGRMGPQDGAWTEPM